jgi:rubrerythrin
MEVASALRPLECVEESLARLYQALSERFAGDGPATMFFSRLAFEERSHTNEVQFLRRLVRQNPKEFGVLDLELPAIQKSLDEIQAFAARVARVTLEEALHFTARIEDGAAETHSRVARGLINPEARTSVEGLSQADRRHLETVRSFMKERGVADE